MIFFSCSSCGQKLQVQDEWAGKKVQCAGCKKVLQVPAASPVGVAPSPGQPASPPPGQARTRAEAEVATLPTERTAGVEPASPGRPDPESLYFLAPPLRSDEMGRLGRYRVLRVLGFGGMGVVFEAEDVMLRRPVAIKTMLPKIAAQESSRKRFLREAQSTAALEHDHIVTIYEVGEVQGIPFIAMALLRGEALDQRLKRTPRLPLPEVIRIGREIALGLAAAHERGLIHRDIKPGNIWLEGKRGRVKILDFGLVRAMEDQANLTKMGDLLGTPAYMAPEQAAGQPVDLRCDLFSLGCVLYQLVTGELPFPGSNAVSVMVAVATMPPRPVQSLAPEAPPALAHLIMRLLAKEPRERPASAGEVLEVLDSLSQEFAPPRPPTTSDVELPVVPIRPQGPATPPPLTPPGRGWRTAALVLGALLVFGLGGWALWKFLNKGTIGEALCLRGHSGIVNAVAFSRDGKFLASGSKDQTVRLWDPTTGKELKILREKTGGVNGLAFNPRDGRLAAADSDGTVRIWDPATGHLLLTIKAHQTGVKTVAWSPDGRRLASGSWDRTVKVWDPDAAPGKLLLTLNLSQKVTEVVFHPTENWLASSGGDTAIRLWDLADGKELRSFERHTDEVTGPAFSPDGKRLASSSLDHTIRVWDVNSGETQLVLKGHASGVNAVAFSPDGKRLASAGADKTVKVWDLATRKEVYSLQGHESEVTAVAFSPDGKRLASASLDGTVRVWDIPAAR